MNEPKATSQSGSQSGLESQLAFRVNAFLTLQRRVDEEFSLAGLRTWMLRQSWPDDPERASFEGLAALIWDAICAYDRGTIREDEVRGSLICNLKLLGSHSPYPEGSPLVVVSEQERKQVYRNLQVAAAEGSIYRRAFRLPKHKVSD